MPRPSIDTGAGLERMASVLQGELSNFDTDLFRPLIDEAASMASLEYGANQDADVSLRIIADHARAAAFLISDGVLPSNEGRGYVLRLIMRRALYHGQTLGLNEPFLYRMSGHVVQMMKDAYPELLEVEQSHRQGNKNGRGAIRPHRTFGARAAGRNLPVQAVSGPGGSMLFRNWKQQHHSGSREHLGKVAGEDVFKLHDTFGLRPDFVQDIVSNYGIDVDREGYEAEMQRQRERARTSWKGVEKKVASPVFLKLAEDGRTALDGYADDCQAAVALWPWFGRVNYRPR